MKFGALIYDNQLRKPQGQGHIACIINDKEVDQKKKKTINLGIILLFDKFIDFED